MPDLKIQLGAGGSTVTIGGGDLRDLLTQQNADTIFKIADSEIVNSKDKTLDQISQSSVPLTASLKVANDAKWKLGAVNLSFNFSAGAEGAISIKRSGELFRYTHGEDEKDEVVIPVPDGFTYVIINLKVSLEVGGGADFSHPGGLGVKGNLDSSRTFNLTNYKCYPNTTTVGDAIKAAFETFILPFKPEGVEGLNNNDFLEYEFIGKLALGFGISYGISGLLLGGRSMGEIKRSFDSPVASGVAKAKPSFKLGAEFAVSYTHEDAFNVVVGRQKDPARGINTVSLFLFQMDQRNLSLKFTAGFSVSAGASFELKLKLDEIIDDAAKKLFVGLPDGPAKNAAISAFKDNLKKEEHKRELEKYVKEANDKVANLLKKLDNQKIELGILHERIKKHTALFDYNFDLSVDPAALTNGYAAAMNGDFVAAIKVPGVSLRAGSFVEDVFIKRTTITFQFFDFFHFADITTYFRKTSIVYFGDGVFKYRFTTGVTYESGHVGNARQVEVFFTADALTRDLKSFSDVDVRLNFVMVDNANGKAARQTAGTLAAMGSGGDLQVHATRMKELIATDKSLVVKVTAVFHREAYSRLAVDEYINDKPQALPHPIDRENWNAFVRACNFTLAGQGFKGQGFPILFREFDQWILYNRTAIDSDTSTKPPNRRSLGNINTDSVWPSQLINVSHGDRRLMFIYLDAGRRFMNLCEDLKRLGNDISDATTEESYGTLLDSLNFMIQQDIQVWFTKAILLALFRLTGGNVTNLKGPTPEEIIGKEYEISFDVIA